MIWQAFIQPWSDVFPTAMPKTYIGGAYPTPYLAASELTDYLEGLESEHSFEVLNAWQRKAGYTSFDLNRQLANGVILAALDGGVRVGIQRMDQP